MALRSLVRPTAWVAGVGLGWGLFEAQWVECRDVDVPVSRLPSALEGFTILHLSDFHLGSPSLNGRALRKAVAWAETRDVDLVAITGDLLSRSRGEPDLRACLCRLQSRLGTFVVLGNHDVAVTRDPFSGAREIDDLLDSGATILRDSTVRLEHAGTTVQLVGGDARAFLRQRQPLDRLVDRSAGLRVLLHHFPKVVDRLPPGSFDLILTGHVHGGQIVFPTPWGKIRFGELNPPYPDGVFRLGRTTLVVSRGTGTAFVPFRFFARPEAAILHLTRAAKVA